jgi:hypothetical protein
MFVIGNDVFMEYMRMNLHGKRVRLTLAESGFVQAGLKLPQPAVCPLTNMYSLTWKDSSFCVVTIATLYLDGRGLPA